MKVLIVHAHPEAQSFNSAMCQRSRDALEAAGHEVRVSDLYAKNFNPVASADDFQQRSDNEYLTYALEQRNGVKTGTISPDIQV